jgi:hypothetical protein
MAAVGAGGFELLPYFELGDDPSHWGEFGYGTEAYRRIFRVAMETAKEEGLLMDFAVAANQGQGVPAAPGTEGLAMHLVRREHSLSIPMPLTYQTRHTPT